jgi:hypothetical protein
MGWRGMRRRFWLEAALASISGLLAVATIVWPDWVELVFRIGPDEGSGSFEVAITLIAVATTVLLVLSAGREWRRRRIAAAS